MRAQMQKTRPINTPCFLMLIWTCSSELPSSTKPENVSRIEILNSTKVLVAALKLPCNFARSAGPKASATALRASARAAPAPSLKALLAVMMGPARFLHKTHSWSKSSLREPLGARLSAFWRASLRTARTSLASFTASSMGFVESMILAKSSIMAEPLLKFWSIVSIVSKIGNKPMNAGLMLPDKVVSNTVAVAQPTLSKPSTDLPTPLIVVMPPARMPIKATITITSKVTLQIMPRAQGSFLLQARQHLQQGQPVQQQMP
mmetsp:Transcript_29292/g.78090  ORF Transcript_29292/g.78090 Transcript_29292/m.78090 type:complete len:261 (+) Transcript_29292:1715-2497(+)